MKEMLVSILVILGVITLNEWPGPEAAESTQQIAQVTPSSFENEQHVLRNIPSSEAYLPKRDESRTDLRKIVRF